MDKSAGFVSAPAGDEVCVTGVSGAFPECDSVHELQENLFNKVDLVTDNARRWDIVHPEIPRRTGKLNRVDTFDAAFFGIDFKEAHSMDPSGRILLEKAYEAIIDAGLNPSDLRGTKTGVFVGSSTVESELYWWYDDTRFDCNRHAISGTSRSAQATRIAQWLGATGPAYTVDTACSSSLYALEHAYRAIRDGECDAALVGGANLCLHPFLSLQFFRIGVLSEDGKCKCFDKDANGYARAEAIVVCFLQKAKDSKRVYAQIVHTKVNCDGYKEQGITFPATAVQKALLTEFYDECGVDPTALEYIEAHCTGTRVGDVAEMNAIDEMLGTSREEPYLIGSVKSNMGHSEPVSGLCCLAKMCIAYTTGCIPPNINYKAPRETIPALLEGRFKPVTEVTPWNRGLSAINSFGFGGANAHVLLKNFSRAAVNNGIPSDDLPRLVCVSGRTRSAVDRILDDLESRTVNVDLVALLHSIHEKDIIGHPFKGYVLLGSTQTKSVRLSRAVRSAPGPRPVCFLYSGLSGQWRGIPQQLMNIPIFAESIERCNRAAKRHGLDVISILTSTRYDFTTREKAIAVTVIQTALTDVLKTLTIVPDHVIGQGVGEIVCAYANGTITAEEAINNAIVRADDMGFNEKDEVKVSFDEKYSVDTVVLKFLHTDGIVSGAENLTKIELCKKDQEQHLNVFLEGLGMLYLVSRPPAPARLYPAVRLPVAAGTPMLAHLVEWEHREKWCVPPYSQIAPTAVGETTARAHAIGDSEYLTGHVINGLNLYPATGYLVLVWEKLCSMVGSLPLETSVVFEDVRFKRATNLVKDKSVEFIVNIQRCSGEFEVLESGTSIVTGRIYPQEDAGKYYTPIPDEESTAGKQYMNSRDIYKELRLRGYQYSDSFRGILGCTVSGAKGRIAWEANWVTFIDCMLQASLIGKDSRGLYVPVRLEKLSIDLKMHVNAITNHYASNGASNKCALGYRVNNTCGIVRSGGVELRGMHAAPVARKTPLGDPVLEKNIFVPNCSNSEMPIQDILCVNLQIILENIQTTTVKTLEVVDEEYEKLDLKPVAEKVSNVLGDMPLIRADILVLTEKKLCLPKHISVENRNLAKETNAVVCIGANLLHRPEILTKALNTLQSKCFIISRESQKPDAEKHRDLELITSYRTRNEFIVMFRKPMENEKVFLEINSSDETFAWIDKLKEEFKKEKHIVIYSQNVWKSGLLGFANCLRREPGGAKIEAVVISDNNAPRFDPQIKFYKGQLKKCLAFNVYENGEWGTYRHMPLDNVHEVQVNHAYCKTLNLGDVQSTKWIEGPITEDQNLSEDELLVYVYTAAFNFRDVMLATGRVTVDAVANGRINQDGVLGLEVVGRTANGSRVMSIQKNKGLCNMALTRKALVWCFPDEWTFQEAATVPVAYTTVFYSLILVGKMKAGESILIHAGSGGVGQAAINVALHHGCEVFTTVGTAEKRAFIKKLFPQLKDSNIGNSRDTSFEDMIKRETNGKGVDLALNCLAEDKLLSTVRCLGYRGRFLEIGKFDITNNTEVNMHVFKNEISFHGISVDQIVDANLCLNKLKHLMSMGIVSGAVRPLVYTVFDKDEAISALRYMGAGKHVGKVILSIRDEENDKTVKPTQIPIKAIKQYKCQPDQVYIIIGGLGGFGLELADWLIMRGARRLVLVSRRGVTNGYQASRLKAWASYDADVKISTCDVTTYKGCEEMLLEANKLGTVKAVFNLAVILKDAIFENQTADMFKTSFAPKAVTTMHLDDLTRLHCPNLEDFVVFSSVSCGRGNAGQTNYGMSNSVMERICEARKKDDLPGLAIQWGAVGDVGLVADMQDKDIQIAIGGTLQQRISSCFQVLDTFLRQDAPVVSSIVVAEKKNKNSESGDILDVVASVLGLRDFKIISQQQTLADLGMDSLMAVEIKQTLEREFELLLSAQELRALTFGRLTEMSAQHVASTVTKQDTIAPQQKPGFQLLMKDLGDEISANKPFIYLPTLTLPSSETPSNNSETLFLVPGLEGSVSALAPLARRLRGAACALQLGLAPPETVQQTVDRLYQVLTPLTRSATSFRLLGYSVGSLLALGLAAKLEKEGREGVVICLDGSLDFLQTLIKNGLNLETTNDFENTVICNILEAIAPEFSARSVGSALDKLKTFDDKVDHVIALTGVSKKYTKQFLAAMMKQCFYRIKAIREFVFEESMVLKSPIVLLRTKTSVLDIENYGLDKFTTNNVHVHKLDGNHLTLLDNERVAEVINSIFSGDKKNFSV